MSEKWDNMADSGALDQNIGRTIGPNLKGWQPSHNIGTVPEVNPTVPTVRRTSSLWYCIETISYIWYMLWLVIWNMENWPKSCKKSEGKHILHRRVDCCSEFHLVLWSIFECAHFFFQQVCVMQQKLNHEKVSKVSIYWCCKCISTHYSKNGGLIQSVLLTLYVHIQRPINLYELSIRFSGIKMLHTISKFCMYTCTI